MNVRVKGIGVVEVSRCKHNGFLVENLSRGNRGALGGEKYRLCESLTNQLDHQGTAIPTLECWPAKIHVVDLDSLRDDVLRQAFQKGFLDLQFIERGIDEVDAQNTDGLLLEDIRRIAHIDVQQDVVGRTTGLQLEPETDPAMGVVGSGEVTRGDGINKAEEPSLRPPGFAQLREKL